MLLATVLALSAAVLHAGWNLVAKRAEGDRYMVLWAQFFVGGVVSVPFLVASHLWWGMPAEAYLWAALSGSVHLPYTWLLARAYTVGDFSVSYPIARGGGAALAAIGGVVALGDSLTGTEAAGIVIVVTGLSMLAYRAGTRELGMALLVALTIGLYTTFDAKGARVTESIVYIFASFAATALTNTLFALSTGRRREMVAVLRTAWRRTLLTGMASLVTYGMVLVAVRYASVGYVASLRESSVVIASLAGWRLLGEGDHRRRLAAAGVVFTGLIVLVAG